ncbi:hypothetical protein AXI76_gp192 [Pseudoalteromonas phage H101]|uniref:Tail fiber protein n=1 Tax=Pseudoalteromonas phage H101 TaxID=1654919 RepID=A0A0H4IS34_9CAUD|nr:hypothetical protein AXI76_gp192 [Pseudoalteromonas phage H101]AKO61093.1 hypothetical protein [Pseudoalteromonas phage H101]
MAYKIKDIYPSQTTTGDAGWPDGKPRNIQGGVQGTGTPFEEKLFQDYEGARQALFDEAGIEPSGQADRVGQSDFVGALGIKNAKYLLEQWGYNYKGRFSKGFTYSAEGDVGLDDQGDVWAYIGAGAPNKVVTAGTVPSTPDYKKVTFSEAQNVTLSTGQSVQAFSDSFALKIFQSPTDGGLTEIQTRTVDAGEVYEVRKTSDDSLATIYSDAAGTTEIVQNGTDNKSGSDGVVEFYIADGDYYIEVGGVSSGFSVLASWSVYTIYTKKTSPTTEHALNREDIVDGMVICIEDRGNTIWRVVPTNSVTPNNSYILQSISDPSLSLELAINGEVPAEALGFRVGQDNSVVLSELIESHIVSVNFDRYYDLSTATSGTLTVPKILKGIGGFVWTGGVSRSHMLDVYCDGNSFKSSIKFDGANTISSGLKVFNNTPMEEDLPDAILSGGAYINLNKSGGTDGNNEGARVQGSFNLVLLERNFVDKIGREENTGVPGSTGSNGLLVVHSANTFYPKNIVHRNNYYLSMYSNEVGVKDMDVDMLSILLPQPFHFQNDDATFNVYPDVNVESYGNTYNNPIVRACKFQCIPYCHNETINMFGGRLTTGGGQSTHMNAQWGVGTFENITWNIGSDNGQYVSLEKLVPISFYNGTEYGVNKTSININNITINNNLPDSTNTTFTYLIDLSVGTAVQNTDMQGINISNITLSNGATDHLLFTNYADAELPVSLENINVPEIKISWIGASNICNNIAFDVNNVSQRGAPIPFFANLGGGVRSFGGSVRGRSFKGISGRPSLLEGSTDTYPTMNGDSLSGGKTGGALSVQSGKITDGETLTFKAKGYRAGSHVFVVTNTYGNTSGIFSSGGAGGSITPLASPFSSSYALGTGSDPAVIDKINMWIDAQGQLNIRNLVGSDIVFTVSFLG